MYVREIAHALSPRHFFPICYRWWNSICSTCMKKRLLIAGISQNCMKSFSYLNTFSIPVRLYITRTHTSIYYFKKYILFQATTREQQDDENKTIICRRLLRLLLLDAWRSSSIPRNNQQMSNMQSISARCVMICLFEMEPDYPNTGYAASSKHSLFYHRLLREVHTECFTINTKRALNS